MKEYRPTDNYSQRMLHREIMYQASKSMRQRGVAVNQGSLVTLGAILLLATLKEVKGVSR